MAWRWRRGHVVPTLQYLQRLADTFGIERVTLDRLVGLPVAQARQAYGDFADVMRNASPHHPLIAESAREAAALSAAVPPR